MHAVIGVEVLTAVCDLAEPAQITATVNAMLSQWGGSTS